MQATITVSNLTKQFGDHTVLRDISISFNQGKTYAITGVSGTGKSTLMHLLSGLDKPTSGDIFFNKSSIRNFNEHKKSMFLNQSIGHVFQNPYMIKELSVIENVMIPGLIAGMQEDKAHTHALHVLESIQLHQYAHSPISALSGGQQQRVALARALFNKPQFLLADELTGNLDGQTGKEIVDLLLDLQQAWGMGLIVSTHDSYVADAMDMKFELEGGKLKLKN